MESSSGAAAQPKRGFKQILSSYFYWTYSRGSFHYDIMVTLILLFLFSSPYWINFNDKPVPRNLHQTDVLVTPDGKGGLLYEISASAVSNADGSSADGSGSDTPVQDQLLRIIEPISGEVTIVKYEGCLLYTSRCV